MSRPLNYQPRKIDGGNGRTTTSEAVEELFSSQLKLMSELSARTEELDREVMAVRSKIKKHERTLAEANRRKLSARASASSLEESS